MFNSIFRFMLFMLNPRAQRRWIRKNPKQYIAFNAVSLAGFLGFIWLKDRHNMKSLDEKYDQHRNPPYD